MPELFFKTFVEETTNGETLVPLCGINRPLSRKYQPFIVTPYALSGLNNGRYVDLWENRKIIFDNYCSISPFFRPVGF